MNTTAEEHRLSKLTDSELLKEWRECEPDTPLCDLIAGEMERRGIDD